MWPAELGYWWPDGIPNKEEVESFVALFESLNYQHCDNPDVEDGYEKVAIYAKGDDPTHVALQLESGEWSSKLGPDEDIAHTTLTELEGPSYGAPVAFLRRKRP